MLWVRRECQKWVEIMDGGDSLLFQSGLRDDDADGECCRQSRWDSNRDEVKSSSNNQPCPLQIIDLQTANMTLLTIC